MKHLGKSFNQNILTSLRCYLLPNRRNSVKVICIVTLACNVSTVSPAWADSAGGDLSDSDTLLHEGDALLKSSREHQTRQQNEGDAADSIILPRIVSKWAAPGYKDEPNITMDDIGKCLGTDFSARKPLGYLRNQGGAVEGDSENLKREAAGIAESQRLIGEEHKRLSKRIADYNRHGKEMDHRRKEIERAQDSWLSPSQALELDRKIDGFNRDLNTIHREIIALDALLKSQKRKDKTFNTSVQRYDKRVSAFNIRADAYREKAQQFNQVIAEYKVRCTGVHTIK